MHVEHLGGVGRFKSRFHRWILQVMAKARQSGCDDPGHEIELSR